MKGFMPPPCGPGSMGDLRKGVAHGLTGTDLTLEWAGSLRLAIEREVLPKVVSSCLDKGKQSMDGLVGHSLITPDDTHMLLQLVIDGRADEAMTSLHRHTGAGIHATQIMEALLAPVARALGRLWENDNCAFASVTAATGILSSLMRDLAQGSCPDGWSNAQRHQVLMASPEDEQHSFGLLMIVEILRNAGWSVDCRPRCPQARLVEIVQSQWLPVVGLSVGALRAIGPVRGLVESIRRHSKNREICILVGGSALFVEPSLKDLTGADFAAGSSTETLAILENFVPATQPALAAC